jgi:hypothetical protein
MSRSFLPVAPVLALLAACGIVKGEPQPSVCESLCDWASDCAAAERGEDPATVRADCLAATEAADPSCADAGKGLNAAASKLLTECTDAIDAEAAAGSCDPWTGRIDDQKTATPPAACATQGEDITKTWSAAQQAVAEPNDALCDRFSTTFCDAVAACVEERLGPDFAAAVDAVGVAPADQCLSRIAFHTDSCVDDGLYAPEESLTDVNAARQTARECLLDFSTLTCDELLSGTMPPLCAGAVEDPTAFAGAIGGVATEYAEAAAGG